MATFNLPFAIQPTNPISNVDARYGPWASCADALTNTAALRVTGLTVGVNVGGSVVEYWFKDGIGDLDLVEKTSGAGAGGTNETIQYNNNGELTGTTKFYLSGGQNIILQETYLAAAGNNAVGSMGKGSVPTNACDFCVLGGGGGSLGGHGGTVCVEAGMSYAQPAANVIICGGGVSGTLAGDVCVLGGQVPDLFHDALNWCSCGGDVYVVGGKAFGACTGGDVYISGGSSTGGTQGNVYLVGLGSKSSETCAVYIDSNGKLTTGVVGSGGGSVNMSGSTVNGITTYVDSDTICSQPNLTFDGSVLNVTGTITATSNITSQASVVADTYFRTTTSNAVLAPTAGGIVLLRPTAYNNTAAQSSFTTSLATIGTAMQVNGDLTASGNLISSGWGTSNYLLSTKSGIGANSAVIELGNGRTSNGYAYIDFVGDTVNTDYGLRIIRENTGENANSVITHVGTGDLILSTSSSSANILSKIAGTTRLDVHNTGVNVTGKLVTDTLQIQTGGATGCVLTSDASGNASWTTPSAGVTNLSTTHNTTTVVINSDTGTDATINAATASLAGIVTNTTQTFGGQKTTTIWCGSSCLSSPVVCASTSVNTRRFYQNNDGVPTSNLGNPTVTEMALFDEQFNNKTAFYPTSQFTFETYNGSTWTDVTSSISDTEKKKFVGGDGSSGIAISNGLVRYRITIVHNGDYVYLNALYMYFSGNGNSTQVRIWKKRNDGSWIEHTTSSSTIGGWPAHMYLPFDTIPWSQSSTAGHYNDVRIEFIPTWNNGNSISLYSLQLWGGYPIGKRNIYSTDEDKNVTFPATTKTNGLWVNQVNHTPAACAHFESTDSNGCEAVTIYGNCSATGTNVGLRVFNKGGTSSGGNCAIYADAYYSTGAVGSGCSHGVWAIAGNKTSQYNYGIIGELCGTNSGAGIVGIAPSCGWTTTLPAGCFGGVFYGNVCTTGWLCGSQCLRASVLCGTTSTNTPTLNVNTTYQNGNILFCHSTSRFITVSQAPSAGHGGALYVTAGHACGSTLSRYNGGNVCIVAGCGGCLQDDGVCGGLGGAINIAAGEGGYNFGNTEQGYGGTGGDTVICGGTGGYGYYCGGCGGNTLICGGTGSDGECWGGNGGDVRILAGCAGLGTFYGDGNNGNVVTKGRINYVCSDASLYFYAGADLQIYSTANSCVSLRYNGVERLKTVTNGICLPNSSLCGCGIGYDWVSTSDCRLKTDIVPITSALSKVDALCGVCYHFCDDENKEGRIGLIAQEVQPVLPEIVLQTEPDVGDEKYGITDGKLTIKYDKLTAVLVEAVKELKLQNICLQNQINSLREQIRK